jgi:cytoskeleton protein RodZ
MNAIVAEKESPDVVEFRAPGLGEQLRNARIASDMDIRKIADKLHLTTDMVDALECDDYSELPARVFVRGYVRNYARLVDLPIESVMAQFDELWPEDDAKVKIDRAPRLAADPRPGSRWSGAVTWLLLLVVVGLFLMWWRGHLDRFPSGGGDTEASLLGQPDAEVTPNKPSGLALPAAEPVAPVVQGGSGILPLPQAPSERTQTAAPEQAGQASVVPLEQPLDAVAPGVAEVAKAVEASTSADVSQAAGESNTAQAATAEAATAQGVWVSFSEDCWVDIRGSNRSFKLVGTMRKGTRERLGGQFPYQLVLGNASAVDVEVNGKPFDLGAHTKDNVARFSISL